MAKNSMTVQDLVGKVMSDEHADFLLAGLRAYSDEIEHPVRGNRTLSFGRLAADLGSLPQVIVFVIRSA